MHLSLGFVIQFGVDMNRPSEWLWDVANFVRTRMVTKQFHTQLYWRHEKIRSQEAKMSRPGGWKYFDAPMSAFPSGNFQAHTQYRKMSHKIQQFCTFHIALKIQRNHCNHKFTGELRSSLDSLSFSFSANNIVRQLSSLKV